MTAWLQVACKSTVNSDGTAHGHRDPSPLCSRLLLFKMACPQLLQIAGKTAHGYRILAHLCSQMLVFCLKSRFHGKSAVPSNAGRNNWLRLPCTPLGHFDHCAQGPRKNSCKKKHAKNCENLKETQNGCRRPCAHLSNGFIILRRDRSKTGAKMQCAKSTVNSDGTANGHRNPSPLCSRLLIF